MNFDWNKDTIRWYQEANQYTGFFHHLADIIAPKLEGITSLCDIGCGLGLVDLELSKSIEHITCIDIHPRAIEALQLKIREQNITNIEPLHMDARDITQNFDAILISFFGSRSVEEFLPICKKLIAVVANKSERELFPEKYRSFHKNNTENVERYLKAQMIPYTTRLVCFEFGQPFSSFAEAKRFVRSLSKQITGEELDLFLSTQLVETGEERTPFFLPHQKTVTVFEIQGRLS
ncbi:MAG: class I SAM-dependent methyltransferase [Velocimicrobium sp.]